MKLVFAFAVNKENKFEKRHFGDADKFLIYKQENDKIILISEENNIFKLMDEEHEHGSKKKGQAIINFLQEKSVNVLVSMQFGKNIKLINKAFIPVKISEEYPDKIIKTLAKHLHWIKDEWDRNESNHKLFIINSGILKVSIDKTNK